jgi:DNA-binding CsgD family transcriptional regulator/drug/metabolite transporter (DMT)-like permease
LALGLVKTFRLHFLSSYLGCLVALNILWLLNLVLSGLAPDLLRNIPPQDMETVSMLFGLVGLPLTALGFYFYLTFIAGILDEEISPVSRAAYILLWVVLFGILLMRIRFALQQTQTRLSQALSQASGAFIFVIPIAALAYLIFRAVRRTHSEEKKGLLALAAISLLGFILYFAGIQFSQAGSSSRWAAPLCLGASDIAPILVLRKVLSRFGRPIRLQGFADPQMQRFQSHFLLSTREKEILDLLLKGKDNKNIEGELFISYNTVRNHVHNIYQKLGVSSRLQLMNLIRTWFEANP